LPRSALRRLTNNWGLKLAALGLAVLLWVVVSAEQVTSQWIPVRVQVVVHNAALRLSGRPTPAAVNVRFTGSGRDLWELAFRRPVLTVSVRRVSDTGLYALEPSMVVVPGRIAVVAQEVRPEFVGMNLVPAASPVAPIATVPTAGDSGASVSADSVPTVVPDSQLVDPPRVAPQGAGDTLARRDPALLPGASTPVPHAAPAAHQPPRTRTPDTLAGVRP
jgi:hypothetical protein